MIGGMPPTIINHSTAKWFRQERNVAGRGRLLNRPSESVVAA
jgi:hypothetical protein